MIGNFNTGTGAPTPCAIIPDMASGSFSFLALAKANLQVPDQAPRTDTVTEKADPYGFFAEYRPARLLLSPTSTTMSGRTGNGSRNARRSRHLSAPISIYEVHLGSWKRTLPDAEGKTSSSTTASLRTRLGGVRARTWASPISSCCPSPSTHSTAPGATRPSAITPSRAATARPPTSSTSWTTATRTASA